MDQDTPFGDDAMTLPDRIGRLPFLAWGVLLCLFKALLDALVFRFFGGHWSPLIYVHPVKAPLFQPDGHWGLWFSLWAVAVPFLYLGARLTLARLKDANLPAGFLALFFVPFANLLFFVLASTVPGRTPPDEEPPRFAAPRVGPMTAFWVASVSGAVLFLGVLGVSLGLLGAYGSGLFVGAPFLAGMVAARILVILSPGRIWIWSMLAAVTAGVLSMAVLVLLAQEGAVCIVMAAPLVLVLSVLGAMVGRRNWFRHPAGSAACVALLPLLLLLDVAAPEPPLRVVVSEVIVAAPPEVVWKQVVAFPELPPATEWIFRAGVAAPLRAEIQGEGVGAVRRCEFSTGAFVEPVTVWNPGHELSFGVTLQPDLLRELTLYPGPRPPHLDDYLRCRQGQFVLEALPDGHTRLVGRTWYQLRMGPQNYWGFWSEVFIHRIHLRVLRHVATLSEGAHG